MMQHWDTKLVQLRKDLDTKIIYKRMESFAEKFQVDHSFELHKEFFKELQKKMKVQQIAIDKWKDLGNDIHEKIDAIFAR